MTNPTFPYDQNGNAVAALSPRSNSDVALTSGFTTALAADNGYTRVIELFASDDGVRIRIDSDDGTGQPLPQKLGKAVKLEAGATLEAKGSGTLTVTVLE